MRKTGSILAFMLGAALICAWLVMVRDDGVNAASKIREGFEILRSGDREEFDAHIREADERHTEEREYGFGGLVAVIAGFAIWPREHQPKTEV